MRLGHIAQVGRWAVVSAGMLLPVAAQAVAQKSASFTVTTVNSGQGVKLTVPAKIWITATQARVEIKHPLNGDGLILVNNGTVYKLDPKSHEGVKTPLPPDMRKSKNNFTRFLTTFGIPADLTKKAKKVRTETLSGYPCDVFEESNSKGEESDKLTIWLPQHMDPQIPLKAEVNHRISKQGAQIQQTVTMTISDLKLNQPVSPSLFALPKGYKIKAGK